MIALDDQPFSILNDTGFIRLMKAAEPRYALPSDKHIHEKLLPSLYDAVRAKVEQLLRGASMVSVTMDGWTSSSSTESLMSLMAHWIDNKWERKSAILHCMKITGSHTAAKIADTMTAMSADWNLMNHLHLCVHDNAKNMEKGLLESGIKSVGCFAHTLQLCINDCINSQHTVIDAIATCCKVAGHFSHSQ